MTKGGFLAEFAPEYTGVGHGIVQVTQSRVIKTCIDTYTNFKQLTSSKDGASHCLYFLNAAYSDPAFTSAEDAEDKSLTSANFGGV